MDINNILKLLGTDSPVVVIVVSILVLLFYLLAGHFGFRDPKVPMWQVDEKDVPDLFHKSEQKVDAQGDESEKE